MTKRKGTLLNPEVTKVEGHAPTGLTCVTLQDGDEQVELLTSEPVAEMFARLAVEAGEVLVGLRKVTKGAK